MFASTATGDRSSYVAEVAALTWFSLRQFLKSPSHSRRAEAARRLSNRSLLIVAIGAIAIVWLMFVLDATAIGVMPKRGTASLWPVRILTDFGKTGYVLWFLAAIMLAIVLLLPRLQGISRSVLTGFGTRIQFIFLAVTVPAIAGEVIKGVVGRARPFVGGEANPFNYSHLAWTETYASFPSGHATTCCALAFAVSAVWPNVRIAMLIYAVLIVVSRVVLLAHHPSDVIAGALVGVVGAMLVQHWFAARRLGFVIRSNGAIEPLPAPSWGYLKRVAHEAFAPKAPGN